MTAISPSAGVAAKKVPLATVFAFAAPGVPLAGWLLIAGVYLPRYYVQLGVDFVAVGAAIGLIRILDIFLDPTLGLLIDRTRTPIGRYKPWLLIGAPIAAYGSYQVLAPAVATPAHLIGWMLFTYVGYSSLTLAVASWGAVLAGDYNDRSRVYGWSQGLAVLGSAGLLLLSVFTHNKVVLGVASSMPTIALILAIAFPVAALICVLLTPERKLPAAKGPGFRLSDYRKAIFRPSMMRIILADLLLTLGPGTTAPLYVYFFKDAKGFSVKEVGLLLMFYIASGIIGSPFWGAVARRLGKHRTIQLACVVYAIAQSVLMALPRVGAVHTVAQSLPTGLGMMAVGFCASAFLPLVRAMVADVCDEVRLDTRQDLTSLIYSMVTTTSKVGAAITVTIVFPILKAVGYNGKDGVVNTPHAIFGLEMCYLIAPIVLVFIGGSMFFGYKLDDARHAEIRAALDAHETSDLAAAEESLVGVSVSPPEAAG